MNLCITFVIYQESLHDARSTKCKIVLHLFCSWSQSRRLQQQEELGPLKSLYSPQHTALSHADTSLDREQKKYLQSAKELYLKALEIEPHCPYTNARCAKALWAMPLPYKDKKRAKEAIFNALTLAPNSSFVRKPFFK